MTNTIWHLHRILLRRTLRSNKSLVWISVMILFYGLAGLASLAVTAGMEASGGIDRSQAFTTVSVLGVVTFICAEAFMPSGEKQITADDVRALPLSAAQLYVPFFLNIVWTTRVLCSGVISAAFTVATAIVLGAQGSKCPAAVEAIALVLAMVLTMATLVVYGDIVGKLGALSVTGHKERMRLLNSLGVMIVILAVASLQSFDLARLPLGTTGAVLAWTPLGAATGWAVSLAQGAVGAAAVQLLIALATLAVGVYIWRAQLRHSLAPVGTRSPKATESAQRDDAPPVRSLLLPGLPAANVGAMEYSRSLRYMLRDSRLVFSLAVFPVLMLYLYFQSRGEGMGHSLNFGIMFMSMFVGIVASNDYGYDGPGSWTKITAPVRPRTLLLARHWAHLSPGLLMWLLLAVVVLALSSNLSVTALFVAAGGGMALSTSACALLMTVANPYPVSAPGTSPWADKSGYSSGAFLTAMVCLLLGWAPVAPGGVMMLVGKSMDSGALVAAGVVAAVAIPAAIYAGGIAYAVRRVDRSQPEIFAQVGHWV